MKVQIKKPIPHLDWLAFSYPIPGNKYEHYRQFFESINKVLFFETFAFNNSPCKIVADGNDIYYSFMPSCFFIQFRGTFFVRNQNQSLEIIRYLVRDINTVFNKITSKILREETNVPLVISTMHIAQDYANITPDEIFEPYNNPLNKVCFGGKYGTFGKPTEAIYITSSKWLLKGYRKDIEVKKKKEEIKQKWLKDNFAKDDIVTRVELEITESSRNKDNTFNFYNQKIDEQTLCEIALRDWHDLHQITSLKTNKPVKSWRNIFVAKDLEIKRAKTFAANLLKFNPYKEFPLQAHFSGIIKHELFQDSNRAELIESRINRALDEETEVKRKREHALNITKSYFNQLLTQNQVDESAVETTEAQGAEGESGTAGVLDGLPEAA